MNEKPVPSISARGTRTPPSPIRKLAPLAAAAKARGLFVYHLNIGQPDIQSPPQFFDGVRSFSEPVLEYEASRGSEKLCAAWSAYMNRTLNLQTTPANFLITSGASEALLYAFVACCDPGDEILFFDPTYANYIGFAAAGGIVPRIILTSINDGFALPPRAEIEKTLTPKVKAVVLCNPNNPTGTVYTREELAMLISICEQHGIFLIVDETYREFTYDGKEFLSAYHIAPHDPRIIIIDSLSKRFSLCGARIGCLISTNTEIVNCCWRLATARLAATTIEQHAAAHMFDTLKEDFTAPVRAEYQRRRDTLLREVRKIPNATAHTPQGAFYTMIELPVKNAEAFATFMLNDFSLEGATTFVAPGAGFYLTPGKGMNQIRVAYVLNCDAITSAITCLGEGLKAYLAIEK